tara:strand:+ start:716 stop:1501 length:786 start_codon:yes stop_codon:yes gene_type:complete
MLLFRHFTVLKAAALLVFVTFVCSSCIKTNISIVVEADGTGSFSGEVKVSKQLGELFGEEPDDAEEVDCESIFEDDGSSQAPGNVDTEEFEDDDWCGFRFSAEFTGFGQSLVEAGDDSFPLSIDGNILTFYWVDENLEQGGENNDFLDSDDDMDPALLLAILGIPEPEYVITVDLPGEIIEHNADEQNGSTLKWNIDLFESLDGSSIMPFAKTDISKSSSDSNGGVPVAVWVFIVIAAVIVVLRTLKFIQNRADQEEKSAI